VEWLLSKGFSLSEMNNNGDTALLLAAYGGHRHLVERLLQLGASLEDKNLCGFTPLLSAANGGQLEMADWLLKHDASLSEADYDGYTSLILAACGGNIELVRFFLDQGASITEKNSNGDTALLLASYCGNRDLVDWLLRNGSSLDEKNDTGMGALISAANGGDVDVVELLLQRIAEEGPACGDGIESTDEGGYTPLLLAAQRGHLEVVKTLAKYGANLHAVTHVHRNNAIALASDAPEVQQYLMKIWMWRPLQIAIDLGDYERCRALVEARVDTVNSYVKPDPLELAKVVAEEKATEDIAEGSAEGTGFVKSSMVSAVVAKDAIVNLVRNARQPWAPSRHHLFTPEGRRSVYLLALVIPRVNESTRLPILPSEMWLHIMSFVGHHRSANAPSYALERGWITSSLVRQRRVKDTEVMRSSAIYELEFDEDEDDEIIDSEGRRARNSTSKLRCRALFPDDDMDISDDDSMAPKARDDYGVLSFSSPRRFSWV